MSQHNRVARIYHGHRIVVVRRVGVTCVIRAGREA
jgi:hypothetical protein